MNFENDQQVLCLGFQGKLELKRFWWFVVCSVVNGIWTQPLILFQVIKQRTEWEKEARTFIGRRRVMAGYESSVPMCTPVKKVLSKILGRNNSDDLARNSLFGSSPVM